jgi:hypothetical protein
MGTFDTMLTVATTIGKIAGAFAGSLGDKAVIDMGPLGQGKYPNVGQLLFLRDGKEITAFNQSPDEPVGMFFPGNPIVGMDPTQLFVPPTAKVLVGEAFRTYSAADVDSFNAVPLPSGLAADVAGPDDEVNIQAQATQPIPPGVTVKVGPYFELTLNAPERTVLVGVGGVLTLGGIALLNIRGAGRTSVRIINAIRKTSEIATGDDRQHITVDIPAGIEVGGGLSEVDISASVGGLRVGYAEFIRENADLIGSLSAEGENRIAEYAAAKRLAPLTR